MKSTSYPNVAAEFVALTHYCRWLPEKQRRETWDEVAARVLDFLQSETRHADRVPKRVWRAVRQGMESFSVMPSMRLVATAGPAAAENNIFIYNCAYAPIDSIDSFSELLYVLMCGAGIGFSIERENVSKLPAVRPRFVQRRIRTSLNVERGTNQRYEVGDSREGWARAFRAGLAVWFRGERVRFDFSLLRPCGARLKTMGGTASGPEPLARLLGESERIVRNAAGRRLTPLECHDICCLAGAAVAVGGRRRAAMISYSDFDDDEMRAAKHQPFPVYRHLANNSAVYKARPGSAAFLREWAALAGSGTGERGMLNVASLAKVCPTREFRGDERTNPCGEAILRPREFCNLSEAVVRPQDDLAALAGKVRVVAWLGVLQSTFTRFPFIRPDWGRNAEEERLVGVSLTGQLDNSRLLTPENLRHLRGVARRTVCQAARLLGINPPRAYTCTKPSGTVSQLVDCAPGCHPRYSRYFIRRYRISRSDPLFQLVRDQGLRFRPETGQTAQDFTTAVLEFPMRSPPRSVLRRDWDAVRQLDWYRRVQRNWSTHNVSTTIYVRKDEWLRVGSYVYDHWDEIVGLTFFDYEGGRYEQPPYEEIGAAEYRRLKARFPKLDFSRLGEYEQAAGDATMTGQECSCFRGDPAVD